MSGGSQDSEQVLGWIRVDRGLGQGLNMAFLLQHEARTENAPRCGTGSWC